MGRRSINTTKSGKYMNPTDQARKEARKKELKKNKKQRQIVRTAVLRGKDPMQLLEEMEKIDQMEYNVLQPSPLNEKVLKDKRKKLKDTFDRVMKMYYKDDPERWEEIRRSETEYEKRRNHLLQYFEAVKHAQLVSVDEIPLPVPLGGSENLTTFGGGIPMPNEYGMLPFPPYNSTLPPLPGILRKKSAYSPPPSPSRLPRRKKNPPGVPPGPPPELSGEEDNNFDPEPERKKAVVLSESDNDSDRENKIKSDKKKKAIRFAENESSDSEDEKKKKSKSLSSGQDIDSFMKEMEEVHKKRKGEPTKEKNPPEQESKTHFAPPPSGQMPSGLPPAPPMGMPPPLMFRPPPMMMGGPRLPPGPPPGRPPTLPPGPPPGLPSRMNSGMRLPPGPPPGMPPMMRFSNSNAGPPSAQGTPNVVSAAPQLINRGDDISAYDEQVSTKSSATIEAKAQMRNLNADVTRFLPTSIRIKRDDGKPKPDRREVLLMDTTSKPLFSKPIPNPAPATHQPSKDDAYMQFMSEMKGLL